MLLFKCVVNENFFDSDSGSRACGAHDKRNDYLSSSKFEILCAGHLFRLDFLWY